MDKSSLIIALVSPVVSFTSAIILFVLSSHRDTRKNKYDVYRERVEKLYAPYYQKCLANLYNRCHSELPNFHKHSREIYKLISNNITFMGTETQRLYADFYLAYCKNFYNNENKTDEETKILKDEFEKQFIIISKSILKEYKYLCKKLKLEPPIEIF